MYSSFLSRWLSGQSFAAAVNGATDWTPFFTNVHHHVDMYISAEVKRNPFVYDILGGGLSASDELAESAQVLPPDAPPVRVRARETVDGSVVQAALAADHGPERPAERADPIARRQHQATITGS